MNLTFQYLSSLIDQECTFSKILIISLLKVYVAPNSIWTAFQFFKKIITLWPSPAPRPMTRQHSTPSNITDTRRGLSLKLKSPKKDVHLLSRKWACWHVHVVLMSVHDCWCFIFITFDDRHIRLQQGYKSCIQSNCFTI